MALESGFCGEKIMYKVYFAPLGWRRISSHRSSSTDSPRLCRSHSLLIRAERLERLRNNNHHSKMLLVVLSVLTRQHFADRARNWLATTYSSSWKAQTRWHFFVPRLFHDRSATFASSLLLPLLFILPLFVTLSVDAHAATRATWKSCWVLCDGFQSCSGSVARRPPDPSLISRAPSPFFFASNSFAISPLLLKLRNLIFIFVLSSGLCWFYCFFFFLLLFCL